MIFNKNVKNLLTKEQLFDKIQIQEQMFGIHVRVFDRMKGVFTVSREFYRLRVLMIIVLAAAAVTICGLFMIHTQKVYAGQPADNQIRYESYVVESGDTLWSIGERYRETSFASREDYIREVMRVNQLTSSHIYEGDLLVIPESGVSFRFSSSDAE